MRLKKFIKYGLFYYTSIIAALKKIPPIDWGSGWYGVPYFRCKPRVCVFSKPYWSIKLTHLSKKLKDARKKYRLQCNPKNNNVVEMVKIEFKKEKKKNNTRWTQNGIMEMNEGNSKIFFDDIRKFNGSMDLNNKGVLRHKGKTLENDCHKAALFQRIFFDGAHLTGKLFDDAFHEKTKMEVKEKLAHTVGDYYKEEVKNDLN